MKPWIQLNNFGGKHEHKSAHLSTWMFPRHTRIIRMPGVLFEKDCRRQWLMERKKMKQASKDLFGPPLYSA